MRYFTRGWANGELTEEEGETVCRAYEARLTEISPGLPPSMARLLRGASLHDAIIESVRWMPSRAELRLVLVCGSSEVGYQGIHLTYRGAMLGERRIESLRNAANNREACLLYDEIDVAEEGMLTHRLLFWPSEEVTIEFSELDYVSVPRDDCRVTLAGAFVVQDDEDNGKTRAEREH